MNNEKHPPTSNISNKGYWVGIDPGKNGGIAVLDESLNMVALKIPDTPKEVMDFLRPYTNAGFIFAVIEKVHSSPQMGVKSAFTFGRCYGELLTCLAALKIPFVECRPQDWQRAMGCSTRGDKNVTKTVAQQLFPDQKVTHAIADAMLIAKFCFERYKKNTEEGVFDVTPI